MAYLVVFSGILYKKYHDQWLFKHLVNVEFIHRITKLPVNKL